MVESAERAARPGEHAGERDYHQDDRRNFRRLHQHFVDAARIERSVDDDADDKPVEHGHHCRFGRREKAAAHAAEYHDGGRQAPTGVLQAAPERRAHLGAVGFEAVFDAEPPGHRDQRDAGQDARDHACRKQGWDRCAGHEDAVDDERDGWRDQDVGRACGRDHARRKRARVPGLDHRRQHYRADRGRVGRARSGDPAQDHRHQYGHRREPAAALGGSH